MIQQRLLPIAVALLAGLAASHDLVAQNLHATRRTQIGLIDVNTARRVGDILTIRIAERHRVRNEDRVDRENDTTLAARLEAFTIDDNAFGQTLPRVDVRSNRQFQGEARQEKDSLLEARISVVVIDVLPNGNMVIAGTRVVQIDDETKTLKISGLVRRLDVANDNTINSSQVADARVSIVGEGGNSRFTSKGPVGQFFDTLVWAVWPF